MGKTVILAAAIGYSEAQIAPFFRSLRAAGYPGDVVVLVDRADFGKLSDSPLLRGVTIVPVRHWIPLKRRLFDGRRKWIRYFCWMPLQFALWSVLRMLEWVPIGAARRAALREEVANFLLPPTHTRFLHYQRYLRAHPYERILLSDIRDVLFQADPFTQLPQRGLAVSIEARQYTLAEEPHNARWLRIGYGREILKEIGDRPVSCSGVTYGDSTAIEAYLRAMIAEMYDMGPLAVGECGLDQGIHNALLWRGTFGECHFLETFSSPVATLGGVREQDIRIDAAGHVLNEDGSPASVVHQYDRHPHLRLRAGLG